MFDKPIIPHNDSSEFVQPCKGVLNDDALGIFDRTGHTFAGNHGTHVTVGDKRLTVSCVVPPVGMKHMPLEWHS